MSLRILVRGGGDLASGVVTRLYRAGWQVIVTELPQPLAVRRLVAFAEAVYEGETRVEEILARRVGNIAEAEKAIAQGVVPVIVDPKLFVREGFNPHVFVDGRMRKAASDISLEAAPLVIGLGPGFSAGLDCHAVIETNRGPFLGRVIWHGQAQPDTGTPERVGEYQAERVLRAPADGVLETFLPIGVSIRAGDEIARVGGQPVVAPFDGVLRGLLQDQLTVQAGAKIGDVDPRGDAQLSRLVSDKALAVGGGVLEAILAWKPIRPYFYSAEPPVLNQDHSRPRESDR
jgi:xanthine dehydrogenase accessory factor